MTEETKKLLFDTMFMKKLLYDASLVYEAFAFACCPKPSPPVLPQSRALSSRNRERRLLQSPLPAPTASAQRRLRLPSPVRPIPPAGQFAEPPPARPIAAALLHRRISPDALPPLEVHNHKPPPLSSRRLPHQPKPPSTAAIACCRCCCLEKEPPLFLFADAAPVLVSADALSASPSASSIGSSLREKIGKKLFPSPDLQGEAAVGFCSQARRRRKGFTLWILPQARGRTEAGLGLLGALIERYINIMRIIGGRRR
ncbi:uncharacterized protein LOC141819713 [Curcuma longa]|uniref:uncharacterized protein LOC141819713 n=1 Tax=Curcuma longa TaxID=136217 RepID=UPI003D9EC860